MQISKLQICSHVNSRRLWSMMLRPEHAWHTVCPEYFLSLL